MNLKYLKGLALIVMGMLFMTSCEYQIIEFEEIEIPEVVSFSDDIIPIFNSSCVSCHGEGHWKVDLTPENAYDDIFAKGLVNIDMPEDSKLYTVLIESGGLHDGKTTPPQRTLILTWIEEGAENN